MPTFPIKALAYQNLPILPKNYQTTTKLEPYYPIIVSFTYIIIIYFDSILCSVLKQTPIVNLNKKNDLHPYVENTMINITSLQPHLQDIYY
jgi:hypothetical protein